MNIGIFAHASSPQATDLREQLRGTGGVACRFFDLALHPSTAVSLDASSISWNGVDLTGLDLAYLQGFSFMTPAVPSAEDARDWSVWQADYLEVQQRYSFLLSLFKELQRRGVRLVNPPEVHVRAFMKPSLLEHLRRAGLPVPDLLCSNDVEEVDAFCRRSGTVLWRPATGRAAWQLFREKQKRHLIRKDAPPVLLAKAEEGHWVRTYLYEGRPLLRLAQRPPRDQPPETLERFFHVKDPLAGWETAGRLEATHAGWAMVLCLEGKGRSWIYDVDPDPVLDWLPGPYRAHLLQGLALALTGATEPCAPPQGIRPPLERPVFVLRRMLRILFDFERSKYGQTEQEEPPA